MWKVTNIKKYINFAVWIFVHHMQFCHSTRNHWNCSTVTWYLKKSKCTLIKSLYYSVKQKNNVLPRSFCSFVFHYHFFLFPFDSYLFVYILCCMFLIKCFCDDFKLFRFFVKVLITDNSSTITTQINQCVKITLHMSGKIRQKECHFTTLMLVIR